MLEHYLQCAGNGHYSTPEFPPFTALVLVSAEVSLLAPTIAVVRVQAAAALQVGEAAAAAVLATMGG